MDRFRQALKQGIDVTKMDDHELRCYLNRYHILIGPVIGKRFSRKLSDILPNENQGHTRAIYQHQLLQAIDQEINKGTWFFNISSKIENVFYSDVETKIVEDGLVMRSGKIVYRPRYN